MGCRDGYVITYLAGAYRLMFSSAQYNASGSQIVTASSDTTAKIWDAETGELLHTLEGHTQ